MGREDILAEVAKLLNEYEKEYEDSYVSCEINFKEEMDFSLEEQTFTFIGDSFELR